MNKNHLGIIIILICSLFLIPQNTYSSSTEDYELQVRCGKQSEQLFNETHDGKSFNNEESIGVYSYKNHYNKKLNKCFIINGTYGTSKKDNGKVIILESIKNINEPEDTIGMFVFHGGKVWMCNVGVKKCKSKSEWDSLVKPYMEE